MTGTIIAEILVNNDAVNDIVGNRVYPVVIPQTKEMPCLVYLLTGNEPSSSNAGPAVNDKRSFSVHVVARKYSEVDDLADKVRAALDRYQGEGVQNIFYQTESDDFEQETMLYVRVIDFQIRLVRSI